MAQFPLSPGVYTKEVDLTTVVPSVSTTVGGLAGIFNWGPVNDLTLIDSKNTLTSTFGKPSSNNPETWFTASNFLDYASALYVVRAANTSGSNTDISNSCLSGVAYSNSTPANSVLVSSTIENQVEFENTSSFPTGVYFVAKWPGALGNSLKVSVCPSPNAFISTSVLASNANINATASVVTYPTNSNTVTVLIVPTAGGANTDTLLAANTLITNVTVGDNLKIGNNSVGIQYSKITAISTPTATGGNTSFTISLDTASTLAADHTDTALTKTWEYYNAFNKAPNTSVYVDGLGLTTKDEVHIVVTDEDGKFSGVPGTVLEVFEGLSRATDAKSEDGPDLYNKRVINSKSKYVRAANDTTRATSGLASALSISSAVAVSKFSFIGGQDGLTESTIGLGTITSAYDKFVNADDVDVSILMQGKAIGGSGSAGLANYLISNIAEVRKDLVVVISPPYSAVVNNVGNEVDSIVTFRNLVGSSSYAILDGNFKYQIDVQNDIYRWVSFNGDVAGLMARTDLDYNSYSSPAGYNKGKIKNVYRLAFKPSQAQRDVLYKNDINPIISVNNQGVVLFGDKTLSGKPSAFSRINVRRLFILLKKKISVAAQTLLFEINDEFSRAQFKSIITPELRSIQGQRGIYDFQVVCDETNNTSEVIDNNGFIADIYVSPGRSIGTISLNFIATRTGVDFSEIVGRY